MAGFLPLIPDPRLGGEWAIKETIQADFRNIRLGSKCAGRGKYNRTKRSGLRHLAFISIASLAYEGKEKRLDAPLRWCR